MTWLMPDEVVELRRAVAGEQHATQRRRRSALDLAAAFDGAHATDDQRRLAESQRRLAEMHEQRDHLLGRVLAAFDGAAPTNGVRVEVLMSPSEEGRAWAESVLPHAALTVPQLTPGGVARLEEYLGRELTPADRQAIEMVLAEQREKLVWPLDDPPTAEIPFEPREQAKRWPADA